MTDKFYFTLMMRIAVTALVLLMLVLFVPGLISASSTFSVVVGAIIGIGGLIIGAVTLATPVLDGTYEKVISFFNSN